MKVTLHPKGTHEDILKRIIVVSDDPAQPRFALTMKGRLLIDVRAEPSSLRFPELAPADQGSLQFTLHLRDPEAVQVESIELEDQVNFELLTLASEVPGELPFELRFRGTKALGPVGSRIQVKTSGDNTPELNIPIRAVVASNLRYSKRLHFVVRDGQIGARQLRISTRDGTVPKVAKLVDPAGLLEFEAREPTANGVVWDVRVVPDKFAALSEDQRTQTRTLTVHTNDPDEPRAEVRYSIGVRQAVPTRAATP